MLPLVSAIIPTYNKSGLLAEAIDSVLHQTYKNIEIIVVDDGSTDDTSQVVSKYGAKVRYYYKENGGNADARNFGIKRANGCYLAFLDHDDLWYPERIEELVGILEENPGFGAVISETQYISVDGRVLRYSNYKKNFPLGGSNINYMLRHLPGCFSNLVVRSVIARRIGDIDEDLKAAADLEYFFRISLDSKIALYPKPLLKYRKTETSLSNKLFTSNRLNFINKIKKNHPNISSKYRAIIRKTEASVHLSYAEDLLYGKYVRESMTELIKSIYCRPTLKAVILFVKGLTIGLFSLIRPEHGKVGDGSL